MKIELLAGERVLHTLKGKSFEINPIVRIFKKLLKLIGKYTKVEITLTNSRVHIYEENRFLWAFITGRERKIITLSDLDMLHGIQTSFLFVFKSNNLVFYNGGLPWTGINIKGTDYAGLEAELNGFSRAKAKRNMF
jgi:hypothetical protein